MRHQTLLTMNPRTQMQVKNLLRIDDTKRTQIRERAAEVRRKFCPSVAK